MTSCWIRLGSLLAAMLCLQAAAQPGPGERTSGVFAAPGQEVRVGHYENTGGPACPNNQGDPQIMITRAPGSGTAAVRPGESLIGQLLTGGNDNRCVGKLLHGTHVFYRSGPGFRGIDTFDYQVVFVRSALVVHATVRVQ